MWNGSWLVMSFAMVGGSFVAGTGEIQVVELCIPRHCCTNKGPLNRVIEGSRQQRKSRSTFHFTTSWSRMVIQCPSIINSDWDIHRFCYNNGGLLSDVLINAKYSIAGIESFLFSNHSSVLDGTYEQVSVCSGLKEAKGSAME